MFIATKTLKITKKRDFSFVITSKITTFEHNFEKTIAQAIGFRHY